MDTLRGGAGAAALALLLLAAAGAAAPVEDPVWPADRAAGLLARVRAASAEGIAPPAAVRPPAVPDAADLTTAYLALGRRLAGAAVDPTAYHDRWLAPLPADPAPRLLQALADGDPLARLDGLRPVSPDYRRLVEAYARLRDQAAAGGWRPLPDAPVLRPGDRHPAVRALRRRLAWEGPTPAPTAADSFDAGLAACVRAFQRRCGLAADGVVGPATRAALDVPAAARAARIRLNLERLRTAGPDAPGRVVRVNIAAAELEVREGDAVQLSMRCVVGRPDRPTPVLQGLMTCLELHPYWNIPQKLARRDVLPKVLADPSYLTERGIRVFESWTPGAPELDPATIDWAAIRPWDLAYKLRQDPGPRNPLGTVKFLFPNAASVYLHGTPAADDFARPARAFSSGCVRVEDPVALAACLLDDPLVESRLETGGNVSVPLAVPVPVRLLYLTAWADADGVLHYRDDLYGYDAPLRAALAALEGEGDLPGAERPGVQVDEAGAGVVAHAAAMEGAGGAAQPLEVHAGQPHVHGAAVEVEAVLGDVAAGASEGLVRGR